MITNFVETVGWIVIGIGIVFLLALIYTLPVWVLWNWLCPKLFNLSQISILEAFGLLLLTGFLFRSSGKSSKD